MHPSIVDYDETRWHVWLKVYKNRRYIGYIRYSEDYTFEQSAVKSAKKYFDRIDSNAEDSYSYKWVVSQTNPFEKKSRKKRESVVKTKTKKRLCIYCAHSRVGGDATICESCVGHDRWKEVN
jgi:hypothetical protein